MVLATESDSDSIPALVFSLDGDHYSVDLRRVANVVAATRSREGDGPPIAPSDDPERFVAGNTTLGDVTVRVLDVGRLFGAEPLVETGPDGLTVDRGSIVVFGTRTDSRVDGWLVEAIHDTGTIETDEVTELRSTATHVNGHVAVGDRSTVWVDALTINA